MNSWTPVRLGEFFRIKHGFAFKSIYFKKEGDHIVLTPGNFKEYGGLKSQGEKEKFYASEPPSDHILNVGDMLVVMTDLTQEARILGSPAVIPEKDRFLHNQRLGKIVDLDEGALDRRYLYHLFNWSAVRDQLKATATGATVKHTAPDRIYAVQVPLPSIHTQRRIASILSAYDDLIENNARRIAILEEVARRLYEEWFVQFRLREHAVPPHDGMLPEGWTIRSLGEVCERITDGAHKSPPSSDLGKPMASVKDMHEWGLRLENCRLISERDYEELVRNNCRPAINDILIAKDGANLNKHTFLVTEERDVVLLSSIAILRPAKDIEPEFLVSQLKSQAVSDAIKRSKSGAAIPRIILKDFKRLQILVPTCEAQRRWVAVAGPMASMCRQLVKQNANLRTQRDLLLPKLISGEIDVSKAQEAVAEAAA